MHIISHLAHPGHILLNSLDVLRFFLKQDQELQKVR